MKRYFGILIIATSLLLCQRAHAQLQCWTVGDLNNDGQINISDTIYLSNFLYAGGPAPERLRQADFDESGGVDASDLVLILRYLYCGCTSCLGPLDTFCEFIVPIKNGSLPGGSDPPRRRPQGVRTRR